MRIGRLSPRDRRALIIGAVIVVAAFAALRGIPSWRTWRAEALESATELRRELARSEAALAAFPAMLDTLEAGLTRLAGLGLVLVVAPDPAGLSAATTGIIRDAAHRAAVRIDNIDTNVRDTGAERLRRVGVTVSAATDVTGLAMMLEAIERGPRLLAVQDLAVRPQDVHTPDDQPENLSIRMTVEALGLIDSETRLPADTAARSEP